MSHSTDFKPALIIVDLQEDFCPPNGSLAVPNARETFSVINNLLKLPFTIKIATKDWHPANHISFASSHTSAKPFTSTTTIVHPSDASKTFESRLWPDHCIQNTPGAELVKELDQSKIDVIIEKGKMVETEMYSAFRDPFGWQESGLKETLEGKEVSDVFVVGLAGDYCVKDTALDAANLGWEGRVWVVEEGVRCVQQGDWEGVKQEFGKKGVNVVSVNGEELKRVKALGRS